MPASSDVPEPWDQFLRDLDAELADEVSLYCVGGFAMAVQYGLARPTSDIDILEIAPADQLPAILAAAGQGSRLNKQYGLYVQKVGIMTIPQDHRERTIRLFPDHHERLRLFGLDPYDLALSKLERNSEKDREDVKYLFRSVPLDLTILEHRYRTEQRPYLSNEERHDLTIRLWMEMLTET